MTSPSHLSNEAFDRQHLWHPYTSMSHPLPSYEVSSAKGATITLKSGEQLIDGMSSWWAVIHGYRNPRLDKVAHQQIDTVSHVMFGGLTHEPAIKLGRQLVDMLPAPLEKVFIADSGSVSVEVAIKMTLQYWLAQSRPEKSKLLTIKGGYHGDTFKAMSVCDPENGMHSFFNKAIATQIFADAPELTPDDEWDETSGQQLTLWFEQFHKELAAVILEPIVQGAGGMRFYHPNYLKLIRALCDKYDVLLIADEIATGFGRTGKLFACEHAEVTPDIICLGKALTGGYMTLAATVTTAKVAETIGQGPAGGALMHGPTFMGNPLACAVASESLAIISDGNWQQQVSIIEKYLKDKLLPLNELSSVRDARVFGAIGVLEMEQRIDVAEAQRLFIKHGVWIRPFGRLLYIMPPYIISEQELSTLCSAMADYAKSV
ncbi:adenosylmethionine--8-amino-7-oxononanoate transaminase [Idiomarina zobellii]|uniref:Adenosylmethionine-8-amino-7-oxononanoate aminotransferase n=1 Tax=Idiomarina zobellii TaxID=86103 RepID=A0A837N9K7_9GAMM|nr:adenosylmethionine--8-amino-7-oxononanoate transaminase [Idiomarina zobellii]KPD23594.1 adenosylmethionine-8-amino-7-oxononanoate aminotransferase [Idiomarina zobellii]SDF92868.1 adenosylmethionine-8-amino-7-oxononanoate aminotransferase apoenzyme [Idiomarina zobellii]